jgi:hypothetical protein
MSVSWAQAYCNKTKHQKENTPFLTAFPTPFQIYFLVENNKLNWKILFATKTHGNQQVQVENDILVESINHVLEPHQSPLQTILIANDVDCYGLKIIFKLSNKMDEFI